VRSGVLVDQMNGFINLRRWKMNKNKFYVGAIAVGIVLFLVIINSIVRA
jgi:hypothetical protein